MSLKDKATRLFEYISQVYSIDLPVVRNVTDYDAVWWQADFTSCLQCKIKEFISGINSPDLDSQEETPEGDAWLSVTKRQYDNPPELPSVLKDWVDISLNPTKLPLAKPSILKSADFEAYVQRVAAFDNYVKSWKESNGNNLPPLPEILIGWIDKTQPKDMPPVYIAKREIEEKFDDDKIRLNALSEYIEGQWKIWSKRVLPLFKANILYDELFSLHQRLSVEGDRIEIVWGHLFLAWKHSVSDRVYHPLVITPVNLNFDPIRRNITLTPSQTIPTKLDLDCLLNLDYSNKDEVLKYIIQVNNSSELPDAWSHNQMRGIAATITGYLSKEAEEKTNLYSDELVSQPAINLHPTIYNAPLIFVRERTRRLWVDDAKKVAESIYHGKETDIPPFIRSLIADPHTKELPNPEDYVDYDEADEDGGELLLPLEYNDQQKEIAEKLKGHFGVLVQGPPGTGKSHTIGNIVSSLLARGKRVLVTSQTENALRVLRDYIPDEIRSLCVSQLGNDTEAKKQLNEAVDTIGKRFAERNSQIIEQNIQNIRKALRAIREEQAILRNRIKEWVELDSCIIKIGEENISAYKAAKECSENETNHSWFPDKLSPSVEPPLSDDELVELCTLIQNISSSDRISCLKYLPDINQLLTPEVFSKKSSEYRALDSLSAETENLRLDWGTKLSSASHDEIVNAVKLLEEALLSMQGLINNEWQVKIIDSIIAEASQDAFWREFLKKCMYHRDSAWKAYKIIQGSQLTVKELPDDLDINAALEELKRTVKNGKNPSNWFAKLFLSNSAKLLFNSVKVDGHSLITEERIAVAQAHFSYKTILRKIETFWNHAIIAVNGPKFDIVVVMPLADIDGHIKNVCCAVEWIDNFYERIKNSLLHLGCRKPNLHKRTAIEECLKILHGQLAEIEKRRIKKEFEEYYERLIKESKREDAHAIWARLAEAVKNRAIDNYEQLYNERLHFLQLDKKVQRLEYLCDKLKGSAPLWYHELEKEAPKRGPQALAKDWTIAWRWQRLNEWLRSLHNRESVESLQNRLERARKKEHELIIELVARLTWKRQITNVEDSHYRALIAWADAMRKYGKGTGKHAQRYLSAAAKAMVEAVGAVPAWIMPLHRVVQSFPAKPDVFDVIITDEASQCDLRALPVLFRAKKILVVGDPEQISPSNVGIERDKVFALMQQFLSDIPYPQTFSIDNSLYEITKAIPRMNRTLLTEHFRCVPQIIEFNNKLCPSYEGRLEPLRQPNPQERLEPNINTAFVENGFKNNNDINEPEAETLVELLIRCCNDGKYSYGGKNNRKRTMGVISLLGENQAKHISQLIAQRLDEAEREERRIICGDAYAFQGDERDVMFLSMVVASNAPYRALVGEADRQRFNVATSRARDQVFLFHSVKLDDIKNPECVRYKLLYWYLNPPKAEIEGDIEELKQKAESDFEIEVGERIIKRGFKVIPQYRPFPSDFNYRIDLVIQGDKNRVAVECDGERWHGPERWEYDQRREAQLRRAGWKFWRISGSAFYRNKDKSLESLWQFLAAEGIKSS